MIMNKNGKLHTLSSVPPGYIIKRELKARGIKQKDFAVSIGLRQSHLSEMLKGDRSISAQMAKTIAEVLNIPSEHILRLQAEFDYNKKTAQIEDSEEFQARMILTEYDESYDMKVIFKRLGMKDKTSKEKLDFCKEYLHFVSPKEQCSRSNGYFHRSEKSGCDERMISTWSVLARYEAESLPDPKGKFDKNEADNLSRDLAEIFRDNDNTINRMTRKLSDYGIKFCIVTKVDKASIDGYTYVKDGIPSVVITKRYDRIDNMAFAVLHEIGHLKMHIKGDGAMVTVVDEEELSKKEEQEANKYATQMLLPDEIWEDAPAVPMNPQKIQKAYSAWAEKKGENKWIVLGRISHETGMYMFKTDDSRKIH